MPSWWSLFLHTFHHLQLPLIYLLPRAKEFQQSHKTLRPQNMPLSTVESSLFRIQSDQRSRSVVRPLIPKGHICRGLPISSQSPLKAFIESSVHLFELLTLELEGPKLAPEIVDVWAESVVLYLELSALRVESVVLFLQFLLGRRGVSSSCSGLVVVCVDWRIRGVVKVQFRDWGILLALG